MKESKHIIFNRQYQSQISEAKRKDYESWKLKPNEQLFKFGGKLTDKINLLIDFHQIPKCLDWLNVDRLTLGMNFEDFFNSIIEDKILSYKHFKEGGIEQITKNVNISNPYSNYPLQKTEIQLADTPTWLLNQRWEGNTNKLNSNPVWVQDEELLICPVCHRKMEFLIQLSSGLPDLNERNGFEIMFGNDGELYGFWCKKDLVSSYIWQST